MKKQKTISFRTFSMINMILGAAWIFGALGITLMGIILKVSDTPRGAVYIQTQRKEVIFILILASIPMIAGLFGMISRNKILIRTLAIIYGIAVMVLDLIVIMNGLSMIYMSPTIFAVFYISYAFSQNTDVPDAGMNIRRADM